MSYVVYGYDIDHLGADTRGRVITPRQKHEELVSEFESSGFSGAKFASLAGVHYTTFDDWVLERRTTSHAPTRTRHSRRCAW